MNNVQLIGRVSEDLKKCIFTNLAGKKYVILYLSVEKPCKNSVGHYDSDNINIFLYDELAKEIVKYLKKGDIVAIKGHIESTEKQIRIIGDRVTFLQTKEEE